MSVQIHTGPHGVVAQPTQGWRLQCLVTAGFFPVQGTEPSGAPWQVTVRLWIPPPQFTEHDDQVDICHLCAWWRKKIKDRKEKYHWSFLKILKKVLSSFLSESLYGISHAQYNGDDLNLVISFSEEGNNSGQEKHHWSLLLWSLS